MNTRGTRRLRDGREVDIGRNEGLRKVCGCGRHKWPKCPHPWHFSFQWEGEHYRFWLDRHVGKKLTKAEADVEAERLRTAIRSGEFQATRGRAHHPKPQQQEPVTFGNSRTTGVPDAGINSFGRPTTILGSSSFARSFFQERTRR
jgi:hypothetical protein